MVDFNLLPKRVKYPAALKYVLYISIGVLGLIIIVGILYAHRTHDLMQKQIHRNANLQAELQRMRAMQRVSYKLPKPEVPADRAVIPTRKPSLHLNVITKVVALHYTKAAELAVLIKDKANALLSKRGSVIVDGRTNTLWVEDTSKQLHKLLRFIKYFDVPAQQIVIEARLVNMNQESARDLGIRLGLISPRPNDASTTGGRLGVDLAAKPLEATAASLGLTQALLASQRLLDIELSALESQGKAKVLSSPRLVTSNQIAAVIESGEDIPYQEFSANGTTSVSFKKAVLRLQVTPQMTTHEELMMSLVINQDADSGKRVQGVPIIATKSIETNILVHNGQTVVLGGIYQQDHNRQIDQIPFLGQLPLIGDLFQRKQMRLRHEALLIFITPHIVDSRV
ncbi:MAG TPA: type IV pilus secretin PilQ [Legionellaceae bacterium]|nr:type IV pilus secretin PilQ [Legionellaceae bacterium]